MIMDETQMVELVKAIQQNPEAAAKMFAASGLTPDQVFSSAAPSHGMFSAPPSEAGISSMPPSYMATMQEGSATPGSPVPMQSFTPPQAGEVPMPTPVVTRNGLDDVEPVTPNQPMMLGGPQVADYQWNQPLPNETAPIGNWQTEVNPAAAAGGPNLGLLMAGLKGTQQQSADQRPIFSANAPAPKDLTTGAIKMAGSASMEAILKMLMGGGGMGPRIPTIGSLMGRG